MIVISIKKYFLAGGGHPTRWFFCYTSLFRRKHGWRIFRRPKKLGCGLRGIQLGSRDFWWILRTKCAPASNLNVKSIWKQFFVLYYVSIYIFFVFLCPEKEIKWEKVWGIGVIIYTFFKWWHKSPSWAKFER